MTSSNGGKKTTDCATIVTWPLKEKSEYKHMLILTSLLNVRHVHMISINRRKWSINHLLYLFTVNKKDTWYKLCMDVFYNVSIVTSITLDNSISCQLFLLSRVFVCFWLTVMKITSVDMFSVCFKVCVCLFSVSMTTITWQYYIFSCCHNEAVNCKIQLYGPCLPHTLSGQTDMKRLVKIRAELTEMMRIYLLIFVSFSSSSNFLLSLYQ